MTCQIKAQAKKEGKVRYFTGKPCANGHIVERNNHTGRCVECNRLRMRRYWNENKELWYFSVVDVVQILTDSTIPRRYWSDLKTKLQTEGSEVYEKIVQLKMIAPDGKQRETDCMATEDLFRVIQS